MSKVVVFDSANCFVCNDYMGPYRNNLTDTTEFSETPIYSFLESLLDTQITRKIRAQSAVCQECFLKLSKYDELQHQMSEIQQSLLSTFHNLNNDNSEFIGIKIEDSASSMRIRCEKCMKSFKSLHQLENHKNCAQRRSSAKTSTYNSKISREFLELAESSGVTYDFDKFQEVFHTETEKINSEPKPRKPFVRQIKLEKISNNFKSFTDTNGIDYSLESFKKAFEGGKNSYDRSAPSLQVAPSFIKVLASQGIDSTYNLETFQKVFGFHDSPEYHYKVQLQADKAKNLQARKVDGNVQCSKCDEKFKTRVEFLNHIKTHKKQEIYCEACNRDFKTKLCLDLHYATDHDKQREGPFACPMCLKSFSEKRNLRSHLYTHSLERKFFCERCGADFLHKKSFDMHILVHDDIRPFECHLCNKRFRSKSKLVVHMRVHTGEKKYECPHCPGKRFRQKWGMDLHIKKAHLTGIQQDAVKCQICSLSLHKSKLRQHLNNVHHVANAENYGDFDDL